MKTLASNFESGVSLHNANIERRSNLRLLHFRVWLVMPLLLILCVTPSLKAQIVLSGDEQLTSLLTEIHPSIYLSDGEITTYGNSAPEVLYCDVASINKLYDSEELYEQVQLIKLQIKSGEALPVIILANLVSFTNLDYFYVEFTFDICGEQSDACLESIVQQNLSTDGTTITVLKQLSIAN